MENRHITADCTLNQYRKEYASGHLYKQLRGCLVYGIIAALLLLLSISMPLFVTDAYMALVMAIAASLNLFLVIAAVKCRNKLFAIVSSVVSVLLMGCILWLTYSWILDIWDQFRYFGFRWIAQDYDWLMCTMSLVGGVLGLLGCTKMLGVFQKIDSEYQDLMANLRG